MVHLKEDEAKTLCGQIVTPPTIPKGWESRVGVITTDIITDDTCAECVDALDGIVFRSAPLSLRDTFAMIAVRER